MAGGGAIVNQRAPVFRFQELSDIRRLVARDLADAAIPALSEDRRFATAYNAALQTAIFHAKSFLKMVEEWIETAHPMMRG